MGMHMLVLHFLISMLFLELLYVLPLRRWGREIPVALYFNVKPLAIFSNYDLSIPIVFKDEKDVKYYRNMAEKMPCI